MLHIIWKSYTDECFGRNVYKHVFFLSTYIYNTIQYYNTTILFNTVQYYNISVWTQTTGGLILRIGSAHKSNHIKPKGSINHKEASEDETPRKQRSNSEQHKTSHTKLENNVATALSRTKQDKPTRSTKLENNEAKQDNYQNKTNKKQKARKQRINSSEQNKTR